jgi:predicted TIM-barrel fold metal-dependent hydrolase
MIVDCHTHIRYPSSDVDIAEHLDACETIDTCVVLAPNSAESEKVNKSLSEYARQHEKIVGFAAVNPIAGKIAVKNVKSTVADMGLKGAVLYCARDKFHPVDSRAMRFYEAAEQLNLPVFSIIAPPLNRMRLWNLLSRIFWMKLLEHFQP